MADAVWVVEIQAEDVKAAIEKLRHAVRHLKPVWKLERAYLREVTRQRFQGEVNPWGKPWEKLSERYEAFRVREGSGTTKLRRKGELFHSLMVSSDSHAIWVSREMEMEYGTTDPRGFWHQTGYRSRRRGGRLPERAILGMNDNDVAHVADDVLGHLLKALA